VGSWGRKARKERGGSRKDGSGKVPASQPKVTSLRGRLEWSKKKLEKKKEGSKGFTG